MCPNEVFLELCQVVGGNSYVTQLSEAGIEPIDGVVVQLVDQPLVVVLEACADSWGYGEACWCLG